MADSVTLNVDASEIMKRFDSLPKEIQTNVRRALGVELLVTESVVRQQADVKARSGMGGLFGRLTSHTEVDAGYGFEGVIGFRKTSGFPYELSQEFGAQAAPGKAMAIPLNGMARRYGSPRDFPGRLYIPRGTHILALDMGKRVIKVVPMYVLVKSIPPRLNFQRSVLGRLGAIQDAIVKAAA